VLGSKINDMKYYRLVQGKTSKVDGKWHEPKGMNTEGGFEFNMEHGLLTEITEQEAKYAQWGSGNYRKNEDGTFECVAADWDSSG